jgi:hypothetical protein
VSGCIEGLKRTPGFRVQSHLTKTSYNDAIVSIYFKTVLTIFSIPAGKVRRYALPLRWRSNDVVRVAPNQRGQDV